MIRFHHYLYSLEWHIMHIWITSLINACQRYSFPQVYRLYQMEEAFVLKSLEQGANEQGKPYGQDYVRYLTESPEELARFISSLHITWSAFYRNPLTFSALDQVVFPMLADRTKNSTRDIRIWSAACAAGEEPYTVAMLLSQHEGPGKPSFRIFASDISEREIDTARKGSYSAGSLENLPVKFVQSCFRQSGNRYTLMEEYIRRVDFSVFDLLSPLQSCPQSSIYGDFDLIFCANLLFYYRTESRIIIMEKINSCLARDGYIVTGDSEREIVKRFGFREVIPYTAIYKKR